MTVGRISAQITETERSGARGARLHRTRPEIASAVRNVLRGLPLCAPVFLLDATATLAQSLESAGLSVQIPAQPLSQALDAFAYQTGLQIVYVSGIVTNKRSHATSAGLSVNETLTHLLKGTGLRFEYLTPDTIRILPVTPTDRRPADEGELFEVLVTASRREESLQDAR